MYVYQRTESGVYTVGFYTPSGEWITDSDFTSRADAADRVAYLNGNTQSHNN